MLSTFRFVTAKDQEMQTGILRWRNKNEVGSDILVTGSSIAKVATLANSTSELKL